MHARRRAAGLVPYPRGLRLLGGKLRLGPSTLVEAPAGARAEEKLAVLMIRSTLGSGQKGAAAQRVRVGSITGSTAGRWLTRAQSRFLRSTKSDQAYVLTVGGEVVSIVGKTPLAALYGAQTLLQLLKKRGEATYEVERVEVMDRPAVRDRYLAIAMSWYAGYGRTGFGSQLWGREQWFWFVDWCLAHKINGINLCMYGYYPFEFEEYPEAVFRDVEMRTWLAEAGTETTVKYTHANVANEFLPELIGYANARGITVLAYIGLNTFNGGYARAHPESRYWSENPGKFHQFKDNLCPSRSDVKRYFDATIRRILDIGFNGILLEESEGSEFCECDQCRKDYYGPDGDPRKALHEADYRLFNRLYSVARSHRPGSVVGIRMWRMGSEMDAETLRAGNQRIPKDTLVFWSNAMDPARFKGWVDVFGPERIMGQDAEALGFSTLYDGLVFMFPSQYSNYLKHVDSDYKPSYPQSLVNDVAQYRRAVEYGCRGITGYAFNWNGWELATLAAAQYGWNPDAFTLDQFLGYGYRHQFGEDGRTVASAVRSLPIVLETRVCEGSRMIDRDNPLSGGLAGLTSLQVPTKFGQGAGEEAALEADLVQAKLSHSLLRGLVGNEMNEQNRITLRYLERAAERTVYICMAALEYRRALALVKKGGSEEAVLSRLRAALEWLKEDYRLVKEGAFDLGEEFHGRITDSLRTIEQRLSAFE